MGRLVDGKWVDQWYDTESHGGRFERQSSAFRKWVRRGDPEHPAEAGRYRLYVSYACPWAHRTLIVRKLKRLEDVISVSPVDAYMGQDGWTFGASGEETRDPLFGATHLHQIYTRADERFTGKVTVPVLWDKKEGTIVNNESSEIIRMLNRAFNRFGDASVDLYPDALASEIDAMNERVYGPVNDGVYRTGFAATQEAYEEAFDRLFATLDGLEEHLSRRRWLVGDRITEADIRLFTTLVRFDPVYYVHFKCNQKRIVDYPSLWGFTRDLYQQPGVRETVRFDHIKEHYYRSHDTLNPKGIVPKGPAIDYDAPHERARLG
jgi:putative glutathione S-transferase